MSSTAAEFHVIDLQPVEISKTDTVLSGLDGGAGRATGERSVESPAVAPVLNPLERQLDEAIFTVMRFYFVFDSDISPVASESLLIP